MGAGGLGWKQWVAEGAISGPSGVETVVEVVVERDRWAGRRSRESVFDVENGFVTEATGSHSVIALIWRE